MRVQRQYRILPAAGVELLSASYRDQRFVPHTHDYAVLATTERGEAVGVSPTGPEHFLSGSVLLIPPNVVHAARSVGATPWEYRAIYLSRERYEALVEPARREHAVPAAVVHQDAQLAGRVRALHHDLDGDVDGAAVGSAIEALMRDLESVLERAHRPAAADARGMSVMVAHAKALIDGAPARRWSLTALAETCRVSPFHLCRAFSRQVGSSPYAYALQRRVDSARALLRTERTISTVAHTLGFADHSHFTRAFLQVFGITPHDYRVAVQRDLHTRFGGAALPA